MADYLMALNSAEEWWRDNYAWFESEGYVLRARYKPGWVPSWDDPLDLLKAEDAQMSLRGCINFATRTSDGAPVALKQIPTNYGLREEEFTITFGAGPLAEDPRNHCIPSLAILHHEHEPIAILVMPLLRPFDSPVWDTVGEVVECIRQVFEGLQFLHSHNLAHRYISHVFPRHLLTATHHSDCTAMNIMMDGSRMYPDSFHPLEYDKRPDFKSSAPHYTRTQKPPRYYLIDFGLSVAYNQQDGPPRFCPVFAADKTAPECHTPDVVCDPFPTDVYYLGNWIVLHFLEKYRGLDFLRELARDMTQTDPAQRPTIHDAIRRFDGIMKSLSTCKLRSRPNPQNENPVIGPFYRIGHLRRRIVFTSKRTPALPRP